MKLLRTIRLDPSDTFVFETAAELETAVLLVIQQPSRFEEQFDRLLMLRCSRRQFLRCCGQFVDQTFHGFFNGS